MTGRGHCVKKMSSTGIGVSSLTKETDVKGDFSSLSNSSDASPKDYTGISLRGIYRFCS